MTQDAARLFYRHFGTMGYGFDELSPSLRDSWRREAATCLAEIVPEGSVPVDRAGLEEILDAAANLLLAIRGEPERTKAEMSRETLAAAERLSKAIYPHP
jgi:hypothetical protein